MPRNRPQRSNWRFIGIVIFVIIFVVLGSLALYWCSEDEVEGQDVPPTNLVELPDCQCPPFKLMNQDDVRKNTGGHYLRNLQTWDPIIEHNAEFPCWFKIECPAVPGVSSYITTLLRSNGSPIYVNRVINNQSTYADQPREIGNFKCAQHTDGSYQWHFHDSPVTEVGFSCQADVDSCSCPEIKVDGNSDATVAERYPGAPDQCSLYTASCPGYRYTDDHYPFLYTKDTTIQVNVNHGTTFYEDLICIKEDTIVFNWYYSNRKLENVTIKCGTVEDMFDSKSVCPCGAFPVIETIEMLEIHKYYQAWRYFGAEVGESYWTPSNRFFITCEKGFTGVVFSDNYEPIELSGNFIRCANNPMSAYWITWVVDSVILINPAGGCFKKH